MTMMINEDKLTQKTQNYIESINFIPDIRFIRVINPGFPNSEYPDNPAVFQTQVWAVLKKPGFSGFAFLSIINANDIFSKPKWIKKNRYVQLYMS